VARKKKDKGRSSKAAAKLPKSIAGVKVPKELREPGGKLLALIQNPVVMDVAAAALIAAASRFREAQQKSAPPAGTAGPKPVQGSEIGAMLAATAVEGVRKLAEAAKASSKSNGNGKDSAGG
jgi:hypothetical protein